MSMVTSLFPHMQFFILLTTNNETLNNIPGCLPKSNPSLYNNHYNIKVI